MLVRRPLAARRGAALVEAPLMIAAFMLVILGMIDLSVGVIRHNAISAAARHGTRRAMVHGYLCNKNPNVPSPYTPWGPAKVGPVAAASDSHAILAEIRPRLAGCDLANTQVTVEWPDGNNNVESRVRVTVTTQHKSVVLSIFGAKSVTMTAVSTVPITH